MEHFWSRRRILQFIGLFFGLVLGLTAVMRLSWVESKLIIPHTEAVTSISSWLLQRTGVDATASGTRIVSPGFTVEIRRGCDGVEAGILLASACLAYPFPWKRRLLGMLWGCGVITVTNLFRIVTLFLIGLGAPHSVFQFAHIYVAQFLVIAAAMVFWIFWAGRETGVPR